MLNTRSRPFTRKAAASKRTSYAIALFNGTGVEKNEAAAIALFRKAARRGSPIAQNRLARILAAGLGVKSDPVAATKWHLIAKKAGISDIWLDDFVGDLPAEQREAGEKAAESWLGGQEQGRT
jgi:hypothetical protein